MDKVATEKISSKQLPELPDEIWGEILHPFLHSTAGYQIYPDVVSCFDSSIWGSSQKGLRPPVWYQPPQLELLRVNKLFYRESLRALYTSHFYFTPEMMPSQVLKFLKKFGKQAQKQLRIVTLLGTDFDTMSERNFCPAYQNPEHAMQKLLLRFILDKLDLSVLHISANCYWWHRILHIPITPPPCGAWYRPTGENTLMRRAARIAYTNIVKTLLNGIVQGQLGELRFSLPQTRDLAYTSDRHPAYERMEKQFGSHIRFSAESQSKVYSFKLRGMVVRPVMVLQKRRATETAVGGETLFKLVPETEAPILRTRAMARREFAAQYTYVLGVVGGYWTRCPNDGMDPVDRERACRSRIWPFTFEHCETTTSRQ